MKAHELRSMIHHHYSSKDGIIMGNRHHITTTIGVTPTNDSQGHEVDNAYAG